MQSIAIKIRACVDQLNVWINVHMHLFFSFQYEHIGNCLLHNAAVPLGVQQMETFTKLSFTSHHLCTPWGGCLCYVWENENG